MAKERLMDFGYPVGQGNIEKRANGYRIRFYLGRDPQTGKKTYSRSISINGTKTQAKKAAEAFKQTLIKEFESAKISSVQEPITVAELLDKWHNARLASSEIKESTGERCMSDIKRVKRHFGSMLITDLTVGTIKDTYAAAAIKEDLSQNQIHMMHQTLRMALDEAEARGLISSNPAANKLIKASKPKCTSRKSLHEEQAVFLRKSIPDVENESRHMGIILGLSCGFRRGEVLGLRWKDVEFGKEGERSYITINKQLVKKARGLEDPKADSRRRIAIDEDTAAQLAWWKKRQAEFLLDTIEERRDKIIRRNAAKKKSEGNENLPPKREDLIQNENTHIVIDSLGEAHQPDNYGRWWRNWACKNGLGKMVDENGVEVIARCNENGFPVDENGTPYSRSNKKPKRKIHFEGLKFHELRHTNISLMIANGVDVKTAQERAGHSRPSTTLDIYSHSLPGCDENAADTIGRILKDC